MPQSRAADGWTWGPARQYDIQKAKRPRARCGNWIKEAAHSSRSFRSFLLLAKVRQTVLEFDRGTGPALEAVDRRVSSPPAIGVTSTAVVRPTAVGTSGGSGTTVGRATAGVGFASVVRPATVVSPTAGVSPAAVVWCGRSPPRGSPRSPRNAHGSQRAPNPCLGTID